MERGGEKKSALEREKRDCMSEIVRNRNVRGWRGEARGWNMACRKKTQSVKTMKRKREGKHREGENDTVREGC